MSRVTVITGGARSGKSRRAISETSDASRRGFVATAEPVDDEMAERIARHRSERPADFDVVEKSVAPHEGVVELAEDVEVVVIDCVPVWLGNLQHHAPEPREWFPEIDVFLEMLDQPPLDLVIVTGEVGMGIVPEDPATRRYRDLIGRVNQELVSRADRALLMVAGTAVPLSSNAGNS